MGIEQLQVIGTIELNGHHYQFFLNEETKQLQYLLFVNGKYYKVQMSEILKSNHDVLIKEQYLLECFANKVKENIDQGLYENKEILLANLVNFEQFCKQDSMLKQLMQHVPDVSKQELYRTIQSLIEYFDHNYKIKHSLNMENIKEVKKDDKTYLQVEKDGKVALFDNTDSKKSVREKFEQQLGDLNNPHMDDLFAGDKNRDEILEQRERRQHQTFFEKEDEVLEPLLTVQEEQEKKFVEEYARKNNLNVVYLPKLKMYYDQDRKENFTVRTDERGLFQIEYLGGVDYKTEEIKQERIDETGNTIDTKIEMPTEEELEQWLEEIDFAAYQLDIASYTPEEVERIAYVILQRLNVPDYLQAQKFEKIVTILTNRIEREAKLQREMNGPQKKLEPPKKENTGFSNIWIIITIVGLSLSLFVILTML